MVVGARRGALGEVEARAGDAVGIEQVLGEVEIIEVGGEGGVGGSRHEAPLIDGIEPLAIVDDRAGGDLGTGRAHVLGLTVQEGADDRPPLLVGHARRNGADDAAGGGILVGDDLLPAIAGGGSYDLPHRQVQVGDIGSRRIADGLVHGRRGPERHAFAQPQLAEDVGAEPGVAKLVLGIADAGVLVELHDAGCVVGTGVAAQIRAAAPCG